MNSIKKISFIIFLLILITLGVIFSFLYKKYTITTAPVENKPSEQLQGGIPSQTAQETPVQGGISTQDEHDEGGNPRALEYQSKETIDPNKDIQGQFKGKTIEEGLDPDIKNIIAPF